MIFFTKSIPDLMAGISWIPSIIWSYNSSRVTTDWVQFLSWQKNKLFICQSILFTFLVLDIKLPLHGTKDWRNLNSWFERKILIKRYRKSFSYLIVPPYFHASLSELVRMIFINTSHLFPVEQYYCLIKLNKRDFCGSQFSRCHWHENNST